ncbi:DMT family transporter [Alisedimentitalea sp. MJ-SS2]|uniref:DMT family transporter n=1 Tax=Aliisedimentitalea sp. MJ-SS2 TaxID=3049795 RepID=UPI00290FFD56|nr:DMT family transporter [Alisedimentitalea sp. MJ-SS2]MDU8926385.1 DMT family transporter [Alisedimentitalea sp. MJ-SS2]
MSDQVKGLLITLVAVLFVVPDSLFVRLIGAEPLVISFWRGGISGALILAWIVVTQGVRPIREVMGTGWYGVLFAFATGVSGVFFVLAVSMTSVANVVLIIAAMPVFAAVYSRIFLAEPIRARMLITIAVVAMGLAVIAYGSGETEHAHWKGDLMALLVTALFPAGLTAARKVRHVSMVPAVALGYLVVSAGLALFVSPWAVPEGKWLLVGLHGAFITVSAVGLALGPRYIPSAEVGLLILLESVLAPLLVWAVIDEHPGRYALIGGAIVVGALAMSNVVALRRGQQ